MKKHSKVIENSMMASVMVASPTVFVKAGFDYNSDW
jgi:hypothetical protein